MTKTVNDQRDIARKTNAPASARKLAVAPVLAVVGRGLLANVATRGLVDALDEPVEHAAIHRLGQRSDRLERVLWGEGDHGLLAARLDGTEAHGALELLGVDAPAVAGVGQALHAPIAADAAPRGSADLLGVEREVAEVEYTGGGVEEPHRLLVLEAERLGGVADLLQCCVSGWLVAPILSVTIPSQGKR